MMFYEGDALKLTADSVTDSSGPITLDDIPVFPPVCTLTLDNSSTPFMRRLWNRALNDIESNIVEIGDNRYFGAGAKFGGTVFTRDISYSGILGLNRTHPTLMRDSLRHTRDLRLGMGYVVPRAYDLSPLGIECTISELRHKAFKEKYRTNCMARRTDDVIWLWAYRDLLGDTPPAEELRWIYNTGARCFDELYAPWYDPTDGL